MAVTRTLICFECGEAIPIVGLVGRTETCPKCDADLHCCRSCEHYDTSAANECREPQAEPVRIKDRSNFCDYFQPTSRDPARASKTPQSARKAWDDLFKK